MEHLDHTPNHLPDLVVQEGLAFQVEPNELDGSGVTLIRNFKC